jgi:hypothetical protein
MYGNHDGNVAAAGLCGLIDQAVSAEGKHQ